MKGNRDSHTSFSSSLSGRKVKWAEEIATGFYLRGRTSPVLPTIRWLLATPTMRK